MAPGEATDEARLREVDDEPLLLCEVTDEPPLGAVADEPMLLGEVTERPSPDDTTHESSRREMTEESPLGDRTDESPLREVTDEATTAEWAVGGIISSGFGIAILVWHFWQRMTRPAALSLTLYFWPQFPHRIGILIGLLQPHTNLP